MPEHPTPQLSDGWRDLLHGLPGQGVPLVQQAPTSMRLLMIHPDRAVRLAIVSTIGRPADAPVSDQARGAYHTLLAANTDIQAALLTAVAQFPAPELQTVTLPAAHQKELLTSPSRAVRVAAVALLAALRRVAEPTGGAAGGGSRAERAPAGPR